jgi:hypothetical protein
MATLTPSNPLGINSYVTAQTLQDLIGTALVGGLTASDLQAGAFFYAATTATPNPSIYPFWYSTDPEDPVFRVFAAPWNIWLAAGPDRFEIPMLNMSGGPAAKGSLVCSSGASAFYIASNPSLTALGFLQDTTASGAYGPVCTYGIGWVYFGTGFSGPTTQIASGSALRAWQSNPNYGVYGYALAASGGSGPHFGILLDYVIAVPSTSCVRALIWGPKLLA